MIILALLNEPQTNWIFYVNVTPTAIVL